MEEGNLRWRRDRRGCFPLVRFLARSAMNGTLAECSRRSRGRRSIYDGSRNIRDAPVIRRINSTRALHRGEQRVQSQLRCIDGNRFVAAMRHAAPLLRTTENVPLLLLLDRNRAATRRTKPVIIYRGEAPPRIIILLGLAIVGC